MTFERQQTVDMTPVGLFNLLTYEYLLSTLLCPVSSYSSFFFSYYHSLELQDSLLV
jgi:hypothetical protein